MQSGTVSPAERGRSGISGAAVGVVDAASGFLRELSQRARRAILAFILAVVSAAPSAVVAQDADAEGPYRFAVFAGGCFWCTEADFEALPGVVEAVSGYAGGRKPNPTYEEVSRGDSGHIEVVKVIYDPAKVSYADLVKFYWRTVDPTVTNRQFCDAGPQYRTAIFFANAAQRQEAERSKAQLIASNVLPRVTTEILMLNAFWPAEDYHQDYYRKNPIRYKYYRNGCGRDARLKEIWQGR